MAVSNLLTAGVPVRVARGKAKGTVGLVNFLTGDSYNIKVIIDGFIDEMTVKRGNLVEVEGLVGCVECKDSGIVPVTGGGGYVQCSECGKNAAMAAASAAYAELVATDPMMAEVDAELQAAKAAGVCASCGSSENKDPEKTFCETCDEEARVLMAQMKEDMPEALAEAAWQLQHPEAQGADPMVIDQVTDDLVEVRPRLAGVDVWFYKHARVPAGMQAVSGAMVAVLTADRAKAAVSDAMTARQNLYMTDGYDKHIRYAAGEAMRLHKSEGAAAAAPDGTVKADKPADGTSKPAKAPKSNLASMATSVQNALLDIAQEMEAAKADEATDPANVARVLVHVDGLRKKNVMGTFLDMRIDSEAGIFASTTSPKYVATFGQSGKATMTSDTMTVIYTRVVDGTSIHTKIIFPREAVADGKGKVVMAKAK